MINVKQSNLFTLHILHTTHGASNIREYPKSSTRRITDRISFQCLILVSSQFPQSLRLNMKALEYIPCFFTWTMVTHIFIYVFCTLSAWMLGIWVSQISKIHELKITSGVHLFLSTWPWFGAHFHGFRSTSKFCFFNSGIFFAETPMFDAEKIRFLFCWIPFPLGAEAAGRLAGWIAKEGYVGESVIVRYGRSVVGTGGNIMKWSPQNAYPMFFSMGF